MSGQNKEGLITMGFTSVAIATVSGITLLLIWLSEHGNPKIVAAGVFAIAVLITSFLYGRSKQ